MRSLAIRFRGILRSGESSKLDNWINDAVTSVSSARSSGSRGSCTVTSAPSAKLSNCLEHQQGRGQINRLKTIKRRCMAEQARSSSEHASCRSTTLITTQSKGDPHLDANRHHGSRSRWGGEDESFDLSIADEVIRTVTALRFTSSDCLNILGKKLWASLCR